MRPNFTREIETLNLRGIAILILALTPTLTLIQSPSLHWPYTHRDCLGTQDLFWKESGLVTHQGGRDSTAVRQLLAFTFDISCFMRQRKAMWSTFPIPVEIDFVAKDQLEFKVSENARKRVQKHAGTISFIVFLFLDLRLPAQGSLFSRKFFWQKMEKVQNVRRCLWFFRSPQLQTELMSSAVS